MALLLVLIPKEKSGKNFEEGKKRGRKVWEDLVAGHLGKGLVEFVRDGLKFLFFMDQLICKRKSRH